MKKLIVAGALAALATPALAGGYGYGHGYGHGYRTTYIAPTYNKVICTHERVFVPGYYGGHYVLRKVCRTVSFGY
jgi:hypothetical protein